MRAQELADLLCVVVCEAPLKQAISTKASHEHAASLARSSDSYSRWPAPALSGDDGRHAVRLSTLPQLHTDILTLVLSQLPGCTWPTLRQVCKSWRYVGDTEARDLSVGTPFCEKLTLLASGMCVLQSASAYLEWDRMISFLATLPHLESVSLLATPQHCLSDLRRLPHLRYVDLADCLEEIHQIASPDEKKIQPCGLEASPLAAIPLLGLTNMSFGPLLGSFTLHHCTSLQLLYAQDGQRSLCNLEALRELDLRDLDNGVPLSGFQGTVSLPNLTSLFLYSSRFSIVTLVCPRLDLLSVIVEPDTPPATIVHELRHLTQLTQLKALHLGYVQVDFLDLRPLKELRALSLDHGIFPKLPDSIMRLDWSAFSESLLLAELSQLSSLEALTLGFFHANQKQQIWNILQQLCSLSALKCLDLHGEDISTDLVPLTLSRLEYLDLQFDFYNACHSPIAVIPCSSPYAHRLLHLPI